MKIVCESCGAKYSIADEKVAGKVFKIRCKRCSEVIIVRGDQEEAAPQEASQAYNYAADAIWHVVVDGEQAGPYTPGQLGEMLTAGTVDWEAYVWAEGFDNWVPMRDVEDLVAQITGEGQPQQDAYGSAGADTLAAQPSMGADPFADEPAPSEQGLFGEQPAAAAGPDLFGGGAAAAEQFAAQPSAVDGGVVSSSPSPRVSSEQAAMTGARNENSVLFSLKNLQALATGSSSASVPPGGGDFSAAPGTGDGPNAGMASGEGSGLIDIRALASATGVDGGGGAGGGGGQTDELLSMGAQGGAFGALGSPMLAPAAPEESDGSKKAIVWALVAGFALLAAAGVAVAFIMRPSDQPQPVVAATPAPPAAAAAAAANPAAAEAEGPDGEEPKGEGAAAAEKNTAEEEDDEDEDDDRSGSSSKRRKKKSGSSSSSSSSSKRTSDDKAPSDDPAPRKETRKSSGPRTLDDLLDGALSGKSQPRKEASAPAPSNLPKTPSRDDVISAMTAVRSKVQSCAKGQTGVATVQVTVAGSTGRVTNAQVSGVTGPPGSCIAKAVRSAKFPKFQQTVFKVKFPFKL